MYQALGIDLVSAGHNHNYQRLKPLSLANPDVNPVQTVISGVTGFNYCDGEEREYSNKVVDHQDHFCLVEVSPNKIVVTAITPNGSVIDRLSLIGKTEAKHISLNCRAYPRK